MRHSKATVLAVAFSLALAGGTLACKRGNDQQHSASGAQVTPGSNDKQITTRVQAKFYGTPEIKQSDIGVSSANGVVKLTGAVANDQVKQQAVDAAKAVPGVQRVDDQLQAGQGATAGTSGTTNLESPSAKQAETARAEPGGVDDQLRDGWIAIKVRSQFFRDPDVRGRRIDVDSANGIVTLVGTVDNEKARQRAVQIAAQTDGVKRVDDQLQIAQAGSPAATSGRVGEVPPLPEDNAAGAARLPDAEITTRIQSEFYADDTLRPSAIDVKADNGVVTLSGTVASQGQREEAVGLASGTEGVQRVDDRLQVKAPPRSVGTVATLPPGGTTASRPDDLVTANVQSKYFLDDRLKTSDIKVDTRGGVVTLSGTVPTPEAKRQAVEVAQNTDGVVRVIDNIAIRPPASTGR